MINYAELYQLRQREQNKQFKTDIPLYELDTNRLCKRDQLIQWIVKKSCSFSYTIKTLELAVLYVDSYLNSFNISPNYLELLGISALSLAAKFNQTEFSSQVKLFNQMGCAIYEDEEYDDMEVQILGCLHFQSNYVTTSDYIQALKIEANERMNSLLMFFLIDFEIYQHSHLELALAAAELQTPGQHKLASKIYDLSTLIREKLSQASESASQDTVDARSPKIQRKQISPSKRRSSKILRR